MSERLITEHLDPSTALVCDHTVRFERRWYRRGVCFTYAYLVLLDPYRWVSLGSPHQGTRWPRARLEEEVRWMLYEQEGAR